MALENPPLLIVSDMLRFRIRTNWTNSVSKTYEFGLDDLADAAARERLKWAFSDPERLRPGETRQSLTERAAASFATVAQALRGRGHDPHRVAHFVNGLVFCMFADDVGLLPDHMFTRMLEQARRAPAHFAALAGDLFRVMARGGRVGFETVDWFNGGLFDNDATLPLETSDIDAVLAASKLDWSEIDPSILGTLFERGLDPGKRAQLGAHYTDRDKIPPGMTPDIPAANYANDPRAAAIAVAARRLVELRDRWLNPPEWVEWVDEPVPGYPERPVPRDADAAKALKKRTLTNLYNARPQWLADAHDALDAAVAAAYGWSAGISDEDALRELLALNGGGV